MDEDPEKLITFNGAFPVPTAQGGHSLKRAKVTIEFFLIR